MRTLKVRLYRDENDYPRLRNFFRQVFHLNNRRMLSWPLARLDYWRWHGILNLGAGPLEKVVYLWETSDGEIAAVLNPEDKGRAFLQVHPSYKNAALEEEMISLAEEQLRVSSIEGDSVLWIWSDSGDHQRQEILHSHGFQHLPVEYEYQWLRDLEKPIPDCPVRDGYMIRPLGGVSELPSRSWASWRAFHPNSPDKEYEGWTWYQNIQKAPLYRNDLDLVAIAPSGEVAAFTTIWYDDVTLCGYFEPVGTVPEHQRKGLASALLCEGMRRLKASGATQAMTSGGEPIANALYQSMLGPVYDLNQPWEKRWMG